MADLLISCTSAITELLSLQVFSWCCFGALIFGALICLLNVIRGWC